MGSLPLIVQPLQTCANLSPIDKRDSARSPSRRARPARYARAQAQRERAEAAAAQTAVAEGAAAGARAAAEAEAAERAAAWRAAEAARAAAEAAAAERVAAQAAREQARWGPLAWRRPAARLRPRPLSRVMAGPGVLGGCAPPLRPPSRQPRRLRACRRVGRRALLWLRPLAHGPALEICAVARFGAPAQGTHPAARIGAP